MMAYRKEVFKAVVRIIVAIFLCLFVYAPSMPIRIYLQNQTNPLLSNTWSVNTINFTAVMIIALLIMFILGKGNLSAFGFKIIQNMAVKRIALLALSVGIVFTIIGIIFSLESNPAAENFSFTQIVVFIWLFASISEEVITRGLVQSFLAPLIKYGFTVSGLRISLPVLTSAIIFALLHMGLLTIGMGIYSVLYIVLFAFIVGMIAAYYRERTASLIPAIIVHILANVGGTCTAYAIEYVSFIS